MQNQFNDISMDLNEKDYLKRDLSIKLISGSDSSIGRAADDSHNKSNEKDLLLANSPSKPSKIPNNDIIKDTKKSQSRYG